MEPDIINIIASFVLQANPDLASRLEYQAEALREVECIYPSLGRWVDANHIKCLLSAFALGDEDFAERYPAQAHLTERERQRLIEALEAHFEQCPHCSLKRGYDFEMDVRIEQTCQQNTDFLLQILEEDETDLPEEGDHEDMKLKAGALGEPIT